MHGDESEYFSRRCPLSQLSYPLPLSGRTVMARLVCGRRTPDFGNRDLGFFVLRGGVVLDCHTAGCTLRKPIKTLRGDFELVGGRGPRFWEPALRPT